MREAKFHIDNVERQVASADHERESVDVEARNPLEASAVNVRWQRVLYFSDALARHFVNNNEARLPEGDEHAAFYVLECVVNTLIELDHVRHLHKTQTPVRLLVVAWDELRKVNTGKEQHQLILIVRQAKIGEFAFD